MTGKKPHSQTERRARMAALAVAKIVLAECALAVVTGRTGLCARLREMLRGESCSNLLSFRQAASSDRVASFASEILARTVIRVAKAYGVRARCRRD